MRTERETRVFLGPSFLCRSQGPGLAPSALCRQTPTGPSPGLRSPARPCTAGNCPSPAPVHKVEAPSPAGAGRSLGPCPPVRSVPHTQRPRAVAQVPAHLLKGVTATLTLMTAVRSVRLLLFSRERVHLFLCFHSQVDSMTGAPAPPRVPPESRRLVRHRARGAALAIRPSWLLLAFGRLCLSVLLVRTQPFEVHPLPGTR